MNYPPRCFGIFTVFALIAANSALANTATWNSSSGSSWNTAANWTGASGGAGTKPTSADDVVFDNSNTTIPTTISLDTNQVANSLTIGSGTGAALGAFTLESQAAAATARTLTLTSGSVTLDASVTGMATIGGNASTNGTLTLLTGTNGTYSFLNNNTTQTLNISAIIKAAGVNNASFNSAGGLIILGAANTATGTTTIGNGSNNTIVQIANASALKTFTNNTVNAGSVLDLAGTATGTTVLTINGAGVGTGPFAGALVNTTGAASDPGAITLGSASTIKNSGTSLSLTGGINNGGFLLTFDGSGATSITSNGITGSGGVTKNGTGTLTLTPAESFGGPLIVNNGGLVLGGANTFTSAVTLNGGTLMLSNASALGNGGGLVINGGTLDSTGFTETNVPTVTFGGDFAWGGTGSLNLPGNITLSTSRSIAANGTALLNFNTSAGNTLTTSATTGTTTVTITGGGSIGFGGASSAGSVISDGTGGGALGFIMAGTGTLNLGGANTFSGGILIKSGTVQKNSSSAGGASSFGAGTITIGDSSGTAAATLQYTSSGSGLVFTNPIVVQSGSTGTKSITNVGGNFTATVGGTLTLNDSLTINYNGGAGGAIVLGSSTTGTWVTGSGNIVSQSNSTTAENSITGNNPGFTGGVIVQTGGFKVSSTTALDSANAVTVYSGATFDISAVNQTIAGLNDNAGAGGSVTNTTTTARTLTLGGTGTYSFAGSIAPTTAADISLNVAMGSTGVQTLGGINTYTGPTTVAGGKLNLTGSLASAVTVGNNTANAAILSGTGTVSGALATATTGSNIAYIAPGVNTGGSRNDFGSAGTLHVGSNGFNIGANTQFDFDLATTAAGSNDLISMSGGTLNIGGTGIVFNFSQSGLQTGTAYTLISGATTITNFVASDFSALGIGTDTAVFSTSGGVLQVTFSAGTGATSGTYTLTTTAGASIMHATGTTTLTTTLANTGTSGQDSLAYSGVGAGASSGTVNGTTISGTVTIGNNAVNSSQTFVAGSGSGTVTITPGGTINNATAGGTPSGTSTGTSIVVYTGQGVWNTNGGGSWGTVTAAPANWTADGGTPGLDSNFKTTDSASFGTITTGGTATVTLGSDSPFLNAVTFNDSAASYDIERGSGGTGVLHLDAATTAAITDTAGNHKIGAPMEFDSAVSTTVSVSTNTLTLGGNITESGSRSLTVNGPGTTVLTGSNSYSGGTTVASGQLLANNASGSATGTGALIVDAGAALGGTGAFKTSTFAIGGTGSLTTVTVGNGTDTTSGLTLTGSSTAGANTITNTQLNFNFSASTPGQSNTLNVGSSGLTFGSNVTLALNMTGVGVLPAYSAFTLIDGTSNGQYGGLGTNIEIINGISYDVITSGLSLSFSPSVANTWYAAHSFLYLDNGDIDVSVVPEPGTWALMLGGLAALLVWQRRKKSL